MYILIMSYWDGLFLKIYVCLIVISLKLNYRYFNCVQLIGPLTMFQVHPLYLFKSVFRTGRRGNFTCEHSYLYVTLT